MPKQHNAFQVGVVAIVVMALAFSVLIWISQWSGEATQHIRVRFPPGPEMPPLVEGSDVYVGGQRVGKVTSAELRSLTDVDPEAAKQLPTGAPPQFCVYVEADILADLELHPDCRVIAEGPPLGGDAILKIDLGTETGTLDSSLKPIVGAEPGGFAAILAAMQGELDGDDPNSLLGRIKSQLDANDRNTLMAKLLQSMADINAITRAAKREFNEEQKTTLLAKLHAVVDQVNTATHALREELEMEKPAALLGKFHLAMDEVNKSLSTVSTLLADNQASLGRTVAHVESTANKLDTQIAQHIAEQTDPNKPESLMANLKRATTELEAALKDIHVVTGTTREVVVLNRPNLDRLILNMKDASQMLKGAVRYVLQRPWLIMNKPTEQEMKEDAVIEAARSFVEAAAQLDDTARQLNALSELHQGAIPGDNAELTRIQGELKKTFEKFKAAEDSLWGKLEK